MLPVCAPGLELVFPSCVLEYTAGLCSWLVFLACGSILSSRHLLLACTFVLCSRLVFIASVVAFCIRCMLTACVLCLCDSLVFLTLGFTVYDPCLCSWIVFRSYISSLNKWNKYTRITETTKKYAQSPTIEEIGICFNRLHLLDTR